MRSIVVVASRLAQVTRVERLRKRKMNLTISLLVLAAVTQAASPLTVAKSPEAKGSKVKSSQTKGSVSKQKESNQTSKRELFEGNFGDRKEELITKYGTSEPTPGIEYADESDEAPPDQSPAHQIFGVRLPQIAKISDVLTGQGPSFEAAVANHLYSPVSVYQTRVSLPTSFEVPVPAASQLTYPRNSKAYQPQKLADEDQKLQELPRKEELPRVSLNNVPLFVVKQPKFRFESYPQPLEPGFFHKPNIHPNIFNQPQPFSKPLSPLYPLYDQLGPIRYPGHILPSQYLHQPKIFQFLPVDPGYDYVNQEENHGNKEYLNPEYHEELKAESTERPGVQAEIPVPKHGYHAHPNGAISFARFSQNLQSNLQHEAIPQPQSELLQSNIQHQEEEKLQLQYQPLGPQQLQIQKFVSVEQKPNFPPVYQKHVKNLQNPEYQTEPQYIFVEQPKPNQSRSLNPIQQHLLFQDSQHLTHPQAIQFQRLPAFKPLPQSQLTAESFFQPTRTSPRAQETASHDKKIAQPSDYSDLPAHHSINIDQPLAPGSTQRHFAPLPPLKPNYSQYVQPLNTHTRTSTDFLPTPVQPFSTSTGKFEASSDQVISSTTIQPDLKEYYETAKQSIHTESQPQSQISQPSQQLGPNIIHQSPPTVLPLQSTTHQPFSIHESQSEQLQQSAPQAQYQKKIHSQTTQPSPRHTVIIQKQELQELIFDPAPQLPNTPQYQQEQEQQENLQHQQEKKAHQLQIQHHQNLRKQSQQYQQELQKLQTLQYQDRDRQIQALRQQIAEQLIKNQNYHKKPHAKTLQLQPQQIQPNEPKQSQQQGTVLIGPQQYQQHQLHQQNTEQIEPEQYQQLQQGAVQLVPQQYQQHHLHQQGTEQTESHQYQQQQQVAIQLIEPEAQQYQQHQHQKGTSQAELQQSQQQQQEIVTLEPQQYKPDHQKTVKIESQPQHLEDENQIPVSTPHPSHEQKKQPEQAELQHIPETQQDAQHESEIQSTTVGAHELETFPTSSEATSISREPPLGPLLLSSTQTILPKMYTRPEEMAEPEFGSPLGVPAFPDVQYFGKYAKTLFGGLHD